MKKEFFIRFLKENNIYYDYFKYYNQAKLKKWHKEFNIPENMIDTFLNDKCFSYSLISHAFDWKITYQGTFFWNKIHDLWENFCFFYYKE